MNEVLIPKYGYAQCLIFSRIAEEYFKNNEGLDAEYNAYYFKTLTDDLEPIVKGDI